MIHDIQQFLPSWIAQPLSPWITTETTPSAIFHPLQLIPPASFFVTDGTLPSSNTSHRRSYSPREFTFRPFFSMTKVTPRFALIHWIFLMPAIPLPEYHCYLPVLVFPDQGLDCFDLESSRVFSVRFPELSLFQISELLHFIDFRKKFIKIQNRFCLNP
jgi:hypothetical protein